MPDSHLVEGIPDDPSAYQPLRESDLAPLVSQMRQDYQCADLLYLLPGAIPIPSFSVNPALPATGWVSYDTKTFYPDIVDIIKLSREGDFTLPLHPPIPFPSNVSLHTQTRAVTPAPLIVRHPSPDIFTPAGRTRILDSIGVPPLLQDELTTRILIVSFGGQKFRRPGSASVTPSAHPSPELLPEKGSAPLPPDLPPLNLAEPALHSPPLSRLNTNSLSRSASMLAPYNPRVQRRQMHRNFTAPSRIVTPTHIFIPGAPGPVVNPTSPILNIRSPVIDQVIHEDITQSPIGEVSDTLIPQLLPPGWIAVVCGAGDDWGRKDDLPDGMFVAPRNIYMPDLMAIGNVLLGKLGYGTVAEAIDSGTAFIYGVASRILSFGRTMFNFPFCP